ncbi:protein EPIDERMAL PATTERNING FACTOR 1 [Cucurbita maxima]|uniref:Epidermal patterning factor-like protein n=1 Tax=Cucurbita maxima TaxID=3661 RepID=A0A6J1JEL1_CUCMA|nr:protein EPIDERMAL PATTERNING FACTOR 1 [Cucurbita maxima]
MKGLPCFSLIFIAFLLFPIPISSRRISQLNSRRGHHHKAAVDSVRAVEAAKQNSYWPALWRKGPETVEVAGSSLPDCSHACGSCSPCRLVMISFVCATLHEAETCPMAYRCMCNNKSYPVP